MDCSSPDSSVHGVFQAKIFEWLPFPSPGIYMLLLLLSRFSRVRLCATPEMAAHLSLWFSRQEHWSGFPFPSPCMKVKVKSLSCVRLFATPWTAAYQAPPSMGFSRQEYWSRVPLSELVRNHHIVILLSFLVLNPGRTTWIHLTQNATKAESIKAEFFLMITSTQILAICR